VIGQEREWLRRYVETGSQEAFSRVVAANVDLVYSAALRQVRDSHLAEDVTQAVFLALSQKARKLRSETVVAAWLTVVTRCAAVNAIKAQAVRAKHERESAMMVRRGSQDADVWSDISGQIDAAITSLPPKYRRVVLLRFFQGRTTEEVAALTGISADAARQRLHRAILRLREWYRARGIEVSAATIGPAMAAHGSAAAPQGLASSVTHLVLTRSVAPSAISIAKGALLTMAWTKTKTAAVGVGIALLAIGGGAVVIQGVGPSATTSADAPRDWQARSMKNVKEIVMGCAMYGDSHKNHWPATLDELARSNALGEPATVLKNPRNPQRSPGYVYVPPRDLRAMKDLRKQIVVYEAFDQWDGGIVVGYADGDAQFVDNQEAFQRQVAAQRGM
jgi:RNA polymerase sigma factor (sigma-70 family)